MSAVKKALDEIDSRVPDLTAAKAVALSCSDFSEAARITNEIKALEGSVGENDISCHPRVDHLLVL